MAVRGSCSSWAEKVQVVMLLVVVVVVSCCHYHDVYDDNGGRRQIYNEGKCEEIYVVREGETLQTIGDKCGDPFIVEENPHIHDPDDVFPGLVIKINPFHHRQPSSS